LGQLELTFVMHNTTILFTHIYIYV
jgi:hypothetical protein